MFWQQSLHFLFFFLSVAARCTLGFSDCILSCFIPPVALGLHIGFSLLPLLGLLRFLFAVLVLSLILQWSERNF